LTDRTITAKASYVSLPVSIKPCPIVDATAELRFEAAVPPAVAVGLAYATLIREFPKASALQTIPFSDEFRKFNPTLVGYQAQYRFESDDFVVLLGPNIFAVGVNGPYTKWSIVSKAFKAAFELLKEANIIAEPQRFGLKYMNFFPGNVLSKLNVRVDIADAEIGSVETFVRALVLSQPFKIQVQIATDARITASKLPIDPSTIGTLVNLDCFKEPPELEKDFLKDISESLELAHTKEKELFFRLLKDELLQTLQPEYENAT
jgi:uncharacterized protein (TIGR04255 family)